MADTKTTKNEASVADFLGGVADAERRVDAIAACALMAEVTGATPAMWGGAIVGFGTYHYRYATGREGDAPAVAFSPRKQALTFYLPTDVDGHAALLQTLGKHTTGKGCLYVKRLSDIDQGVLGQMVRAGYASRNGKTLTPAGTQ